MMSFRLEELVRAAEGALAHVIDESGRLLQLNEAETRTYVIDPLLNALGYHGLDRIRRECPLEASGQVVDYLLTAGDSRVVVEAKQIKATPTSKDASQLVGYCATEGVRWALLTTGAEWQIFDVETSGNWAAKRVATVQVADPRSAGRLGEVLKPLGLFTFETLSQDDSSLQEWTRSVRIREHIERLLGDTESDVVRAIVDELQVLGLAIESDEVVSFIRGPVELVPTTATIRQSVAGPKLSEVSNYYVFPASSAGGFTAIEHLDAWLRAGFWGLRKSTPHVGRLAAWSLPLSKTRARAAGANGQPPIISINRWRFGSTECS